jgi:hypothetical protein
VDEFMLDSAGVDMAVRIRFAKEILGKSLIF